MDSLSPNIFVAGMPQTIAFYNKLGFKVEMSVPEDGDLDWCMMGRGNVNFMFQTYKSLGDHLM
jgi:predicted lactoylglutathione lyase